MQLSQQSARFKKVVNVFLHIKHAKINCCIYPKVFKNKSILGLIFLYIFLVFVNYSLFLYNYAMIIVIYLRFSLLTNNWRVLKALCSSICIVYRITWAKLINISAIAAWEWSFSSWASRWNNFGKKIKSGIFNYIIGIMSGILITISIYFIYIQM